MSTGNRIRYAEHKYKAGHKVSLRAYTSKKTGAKYRIVLKLDTDKELQYFIRNERTKKYVYKSNIYTNLNVLKGAARNELERFGVTFKKEVRDRTYGLCSKGYSQKEHEASERKKVKEEDEL
jgi:hypothetical protein